jgi:circadian clock protein KaiC
MASADDADGFEKLSTGVAGLDDLLNGGIPDGNVTLVSGPPGTGKSTFALQFLIEGAESDSTGVYISLGEARERIVRNLREYGWDIDTHLEADRLEIMSPELYKYDTLMRDMKNTARDMEADFIVLDSVTVLKSYFEDEFTIRRKIMELKKLFERLGATTIMTAENAHSQRQAIGVEEYVVDGVIELYYEKEDDGFQRYIAVKKMRGTEHAMKIYPLKIGKGGITVEN